MKCPNYQFLIFVTMKSTNFKLDIQVLYKLENPLLLEQNIIKKKNIYNLSHYFEQFSNKKYLTFKTYFKRLHVHIWRYKYMQMDACILFCITLYYVKVFKVYVKYCSNNFGLLGRKHKELTNNANTTCSEISISRISVVWNFLKCKKSLHFNRNGYQLFLLLITSRAISNKHCLMKKQCFLCHTQNLSSS